MAKRGIRLTALLSVLAAVMIGVLVPSVALAAPTPFTGGADQWPAYVPSDHTPVAVHFSAEASGGLAANTLYNVKVRYTVGTSPSPTTNRGFTWNPITFEWVQERDVRGWTAFPSVTTDASGAISSSSGWVFAKFGDDTQSGQYHLMISLSASGGATFNSSILPTVTVLDSRVGGSWVHNGLATGKPASKRAAITDAASSTVLSLSKTEAQGVDDDSNGIVDDEDWGPAGSTGDFHMSVPASTGIGVNLNQAVWAPATGFVSGPADVDLAISAADTIAPTAPGLLGSSSGDTTASLVWTAASDLSGVAGYYVYRWSPAPLGAPYSPVHSRVATLGSGVTTFDDNGLANGTTYVYEVRAFDASSNVGPRSMTTTASPTVAGPQVQVTPASPDGDDDWYVTTPTVTLQVGLGRTALYSFEATPSTWTTYTAPINPPSGVSTLLYRETDGVTMSATETLGFKVDTSSPVAAVSAPAFSVPVSKSKTFGVSWSAVDVGSGAASYDVQYRTSTTGTWVAWRASTSDTSALFTGAAGSSNYFRVRGIDAAGNVGEWTDAACTVVPFDQSKAHLSSGWKTASNSNYYLGSARYTTKKGASATLSFTNGTSYLVANSGPKLGKIAVYWGGKKVRTVNLHSSSTKYRQVFKLISSTGSKAKTVKLVNLGASGHSRVEIDGFAFKR
jgi:hypothetical protein